MLYFYNSCTILKPIHYHLVSCFNVSPRILYTLMQLGIHRLNHFPLEISRNSTKSVSNLSFQFIKYSWF